MLFWWPSVVKFEEKVREREVISSLYLVIVIKSKICHFKQFSVIAHVIIYSKLNRVPTHKALNRLFTILGTWGLKTI